MIDWTAVVQTQSVWSIGQLGKSDIAKLNRMVKKGEIKKGRFLWPWVTVGTCTKTVYYKREGDLWR